MKNILYFLTLLLLFSCQDEQNIEDEVLNCLASKIDDGSEISSIDFFDSLKRIEIICQDEGYLNNLDKSGYMRFLDSIFSSNNDNFFLLLDNLNKKVPQFGNVGTSLILGHFKVCMYNVMLSTESNSDYLNKKMYQFEQLEMNGFTDYQPLASYLNTVNFDIERDRLFLLNIFYNYLNQKFDNNYSD